MLVVTFEKQWLAQAYQQETGTPWPILLDPTRRLYTDYGMEYGRWWELFGPPALWSYAKLISQGRRPRRPTDDVTQLGGDVLIDPAGVVRLHHVGQGPADRPPVEHILQVVASNRS